MVSAELNAGSSGLLKRIFVISIITLFALLVLGLIFNKGSTQRNVFFAQGSDAFMDTFNVQMYVQGNDPYRNEINGRQEKPYPPIVYLAYELWNRIAGYEGGSASAFKFSNWGVISIVLFSTFSLLLLFSAMLLLKNGDQVERMAVVFPMLLSGVTLFTVERANTVMIVTFFVVLFVALHDSEKPALRHLAYLMLSLATVAKIYPAIFGLLMVRRRDIQGCVLSFAYLVVLFFVPFLFLAGGFDNLRELLENVRLNSAIYSQAIPQDRLGLTSFPIILAKRITFGEDSLSLILQLVNLASYAIALLSITFAILESSAWKRVTLLAGAAILLAPNSAFYMGLYLFPGIILFFNRTDHGRVDFLYLALLVVFLNPLQIAFGHFFTSRVLSNIAFILIMLLLLVESGSAWIAARAGTKPRVIR